MINLLPKSQGTIWNSPSSKSIICSISLLLLGLFQASCTMAQSFTQNIHKTARFADPSDPGNTFRLMNINGAVTVEAYDGQVVELSVDEEIEGSRQEIAQARRDLKFKLERRGNLILAYLDAPFITLKKEDGELQYNIERDGEDYEFTHTIHVRVPRGILLKSSVINCKAMTINGPFKEVIAHTVNGALQLHHLQSRTEASTVNGDITVSYDRSPDRNSSYHTVNGRIDVSMPGSLSADVYFESMNGDFYTNFTDIQRLKSKVHLNRNNHGSGTTYRIDEFRPVRIGQGGTELRFKVLNGDVYLRKQS